MFENKLCCVVGWDDFICRYKGQLPTTTGCLENTVYMGYEGNFPSSAG